MLRMQHILLLMIGLSLTGCERGPRPQSPLSMESTGKPTEISFAPEYGRRKSAANDPNNAGNPDNGGDANAPQAGNDVTINKNNLETIKIETEYHVPIVLLSEVNKVGDNVPVNEIISRSNFFSRVNANIDLNSFKHTFEVYHAANNNKSPQTVAEFVKMLKGDNLNLPDLPKDTSFYIYDPSKTKNDKELKNMEYLKVFEG
jgi:hypothetical protein